MPLAAKRERAKGELFSAEGYIFVSFGGATLTFLYILDIIRQYDHFDFNVIYIKQKTQESNTDESNRKKER